MPGIQATVVARQLPDAHADPCPDCAGPRRWLSLVVRVGRRHVGELIHPYCPDCDA